MFTRAVDAYRRIRNTFRFILGNLADYKPESDAVAFEEQEEIDRYAQHRLAEFTAEVTKAYEAYEFHKIYHAVHNYCAVDLSGFYLDILKDRLYASARDSRLRRSAQTALHSILSALVRVVAPILVHTAEETWQAMDSGDEAKTESVHLAAFPEACACWLNDELAARWDRILEVRDRVLAALEEARQSGVIGKPLESRVTLCAPEELYAFLMEYEQSLPSIFIVSQVVLTQTDGDELTVGVEKPLGAKCARCWLVLESVGTVSDHPELCERCAAAL